MTTNSSSNIPTGVNGTILQGKGVGTDSAFTTATYPSTTTANNLLYSSGTNTVANLATANDGVLVTDNSGVPSILAGPSVTGEVLISNAAGAPSWSSTTGAIFWNDAVATPVTAAAGNGYIADNGAVQTVVNLPATVAVGSVFAVQGKGSGGFTLVANTGQVINFGASPTSSGGSLTSTNTFDSVTIVCITANTTYAVISAVGNLTVA